MDRGLKLVACSAAAVLLGIGPAWAQQSDSNSQPKTGSATTIPQSSDPNSSTQGSASPSSEAGSTGVSGQSDAKSDSNTSGMTEPSASPRTDEDSKDQGLHKSWPEGQTVPPGSEKKTDEQDKK